MYQNISISPIFFDALLNISDLKVAELLNILLTERILCDKDKIMLEEYDKKLIELDEAGNITPLKKAIIETLTLSNSVFFKNVLLKKRRPADYFRYESEKSILQDDEWKIILSNNINEIQKLKFRLENSIEIVDPQSYIRPSEDSRIRTIEIIDKSLGDEFDFRKWVVKYLKNTEKLIIHDGYACHNYEYEDLEFIVKSCQTKTKIKIITLANEDINVEEQLIKLKKKMQEKNLNYEIINDKKIMKDRYLKTDHFFINLGHALGATENKFGHYKCRRQFIISVSKNL